MQGAGLGVALAATSGAQALATLGVFALPVLVAQASVDYGLGVSSIGYQVALTYLAAALASMAAPRVLHHLGPLRGTQLALLSAALAVALLAAASLPLGILASILLGAAYALTNPAASVLLARLAPPRRRNMVFAVKQTGVPLGVAVAGFVLPSLAATFGWQAAMLTAAATLALLALGLQPLRAGWDAERGGTTASQPPPRVVGLPSLRALALTGGAFATVQIAIGAHMVAMLVLDFAWDPVSAGALVGLCQLVGALARLGWAVVADAWRSGLTVLALIGLLSAALLLLLPAARSAEPWAVALLFVLLGATMTGWNGVLIAESVRLAPTGGAAAASGMVLSMTFAGAVIGPATVALLATLLGGYATVFALGAVLPVLGAIIAWRARRLSA